MYVSMLFACDHNVYENAITPAAIKDEKKLHLGEEILRTSQNTPIMIPNAESWLTKWSLNTALPHGIRVNTSAKRRYAGKPGGLGIPSVFAAAAIPPESIQPIVEDAVKRYIPKTKMRRSKKGPRFFSDFKPITIR